MIACNSISKSGFLLLESIIACTLMSLIVLYSAQYQWHTHIYNIRIHKQIQMLFDIHSFFEEKRNRSIFMGNKEFKSGNMRWHKLSAIQKNSVPLEPTHITFEYTVAGVVHSFTIVSVN